MPRYALVRMEDLQVRNVASITTVPTAPPGFRNIVENVKRPELSEWTAGNEPQVGWFWNGTIPATFAAPPEPVDQPLDVPAAVAAVGAAMTELTRRQTQLSEMLGTDD